MNPIEHLEHHLFELNNIQNPVVCKYILEEAKEIYNTEKETLYTKEQMIEYGKFIAMMTGVATVDEEIAKMEHDECFELFLKQPKQ